MVDHDSDASSQERKMAVRRRALAARQDLPGKIERSERVAQRLFAMPEFRAARTVLAYMATAAEVETRGIIQRAWEAGKRVAVPYCAGDELRLCWLASFDQLLPGTLGILEPKLELRTDDGNGASPLDIELALVPGVAFDRRGGRVGFGKGYYDRLLVRLNPAARTVGLAFECQLFESVPLVPHDVVLQTIITEANVYSQEMTS